MANDQTTTSTCIGCGQPFTYVVKLRRSGNNKNYNQYAFRKVCDECRRKKAIETSKRWKQERGLRLPGEKNKAVKFEGLATSAHSEIAKALKMTRRAVSDLEQEVLFKIRNIPQLRQLWDTFKSEGITVNAGELLSGGLFSAKAGDELLGYQMAVVDWWVLHDEIVANGDKANAEECLKEILRFQRTIVETIENM